MQSESHVCRHRVRDTLMYRCIKMRIDVYREASKHVSALFDADRTISKLYTPRRCYTLTKSRYSTAISVGTTEIRESRLLGQSPAIADERSDLEKQILQLGKVQARYWSSSNDDRERHFLRSAKRQKRMKRRRKKNRKHFAIAIWKLSAALTNLPTKRRT